MPASSSACRADPAARVLLTETIHATAVACDGRAVLIRGASGTGKSGLALHLIAMGATLVADDQVRLEVDADGLWAGKPAGLPGKIEARGVGLLAAPMAVRAKLCVVVDMDHTEADRLPAPREVELLGVPVTLLRKVDAPHFPAAVLLYLKHNADKI